LGFPTGWSFTSSTTRQQFSGTIHHRAIIYLVDDTPTSILEAYASQDADYWKEAVRSEMDSILANGDFGNY
jgi:hypothetical protein